MMRVLDNPLRRWRMGNELTLVEVADLIGLFKAHLSGPERRELLAPALNRVKIAGQRGAPVRDLFEIHPLEGSA